MMSSVQGVYHIWGKRARKGCPGTFFEWVDRGKGRKEAVYARGRGGSVQALEKGGVVRRW